MARSAVHGAVAFPRAIVVKTPLYLGSVRIWESLYAMPFAYVGMVLAGHAKVKMDDGREYDLREGDSFYVAPGHDSWVVGDEPYVSLHFMGSEDYAA